tara:strand:- start:2350 stop:3210 length:861 start_codon:yes stop_codon:yes gene_type:complete
MYQTNLFRKNVRKQAQNFSNTDTVETALFDFVNGLKIPDFGEKYIERHVKESHTLSKKQRDKYTLRFDVPAHGFFRLKDNGYAKRSRDFFSLGESRYFENPFNFSLFYGWSCIASLGFEPGFDNIMIRELKGTTVRVNPLQKIKWTHALVSFAVDWAKALNIPEVRILSASNNYLAQRTYQNLQELGYLPRDMTFQESLRHEIDQETKNQIAKHSEWEVKPLPNDTFMLYDVTARRLKFNTLRNGNYSLILTPKPVSKPQQPSESPHQSNQSYLADKTLSHQAIQQ